MGKIIPWIKNRKMLSENFNFTKVKKNYLKFLKSQEVLSEPFRNKNEQLKNFYVPLSEKIYKKFLRDKKTKIIGLTGGQGSGKSTISNILKIILHKGFGLKTIVFSIDDFYKTRKEREKMSKKISPLFYTRGVPGTHDTKLLLTCLKNMKKSNLKKILIPKFDKSIDDRVSKKKWQKIYYKPDIIIFEGWCVGVNPQKNKDLIIPINKLEKEKDIKNILLSTSTLSSSKIFKKFKFKKTIHQFYPIDNHLIINKFLDHWKPSSVFFVESEIWPEMLRVLKTKNIKIYLLNARISKQSFIRWKKFRKIGIKIFNVFDYIFPQNQETLNYLKYFKVKKLKILGNLKFSESQKLSSNKALPKIFKKRRIFCAASTHNNEEEIISDVHLSLKKNINNLITVIIPRHIERSQKILNNLREKNLNCICHSEKKKLSKNTDIFF